VKANARLRGKFRSFERTAFVRATARRATDYTDFAHWNCRAVGRSRTPSECQLLWIARKQRTYRASRIAFGCADPIEQLLEPVPSSATRHYGRGCGVGRGLGVGLALGVAVAVGVGVGVTVAVGVTVGVTVGETVAVGVAVGVGVGVTPDCARYLPPVLKSPASPAPPQTIISLPLDTAVCLDRAVGASAVLVAVQLSVPGSYLPPVFKTLLPSYPPQTTISFPVGTAVCPPRPVSALTVLVAVQASVPGIYLPPEPSTVMKFWPPKMII
jgi:hypothetical protein